MAEENKPVEVLKAEVPATITDAVAATETPAQPEIKADETTPDVTDAAKDTTETPAAETTTEAAKEEPKKELVPIEQGQLEHKGSNFPKNFIYTKKFFWFGNEPVDVKKIPALVKDHHLAAWASETGKGLLFVNEKGTDQAAPTSAIHLADASEPTTDGPTKFILSSKGHKHTFKAPNAADRDNWVAQLKVKIAEAKELAKTIIESEKYKSTIASFTSAAAVVKKEDKVEETPKAVEETPKATEEAPVDAAAATTEATTEAPKEEAAKEVKADEGKRSASKKRASIFVSLLGKKEDKKEEKAEEKKIEEATPAEEAATSADVTETPAATTDAAVVPETTEAVKEPDAAAAVAEPVAETTETPAKVAEKPTPSKRASIFSGLSFGKKSKPEEAAPAPPAKDTEVSETAPVIPKPDATEPLSTEVASPEVPVETTNTEAATAPVINGDKKAEMKSDKRKSSFPFAFGKKSEDGEASTSPEAKEKANPFSKLRATIKGKGKAADKAEEKPAEATKIDEDAAVEEVKPTEEVKPVEETTVVPAKTEEVPEPAKETPVTSTPVVAASA